MRGETVEVCVRVCVRDFTIGHMRCLFDLLICIISFILTFIHCLLYQDYSCFVVLIFNCVLVACGEFGLVCDKL